MSIFTASLRVPQGWDSCVKFTLYSQNLPERLTQCKTPDSGTSTFNISDLHVPRTYFCRSQFHCWRGFWQIFKHLNIAITQFLVQSNRKVCTRGK